MGILERADEQGRVHEVFPGVASVKEHGLAIGRTHLRANEILRDLAAMELGTSAPTAPSTPVTPTEPVAPAAPAAPAAPPALTAPVVPPAPAAPAVEPPAPAHPEETETGMPAAGPAPAGSPAPESPSSGASAADVEAALLAVVSEKTGYPAEMLDLGMDLEADLGIDSIKRVEIMGVLQERFPSPTPVGPEQLAELRTLSEIVGFVLSLGGPSARPQASATATQTAPAQVVNTADVAAALLGIVSEKTGYPAETLDLGMDVEADLGIDSIKRVEIMGVLQENFPSPTPVGPEQLAELRTLNEIVGFVLELREPGAASAPASASDPSTTTAAEPSPASAPTPSADDVRGVLLDVVAGKTGYPADMLDLGMDVEADLGIDSIKRVEIMGVLQERFPSPTPVGPEQLAELRTLSDIVGFVTGLSGAASGERHVPEVTTAEPTVTESTAIEPAPAAAPATAALGRGQAALVDLPVPDRLVGAYPQGAAAIVVDDGSAVAG
ncbi:type I polyketide synthase, partial [Streptomyces sp. SA15]